MLIFLLFAISLKFSKSHHRVNNKANKVHYIQSYILIASYTHTDHTKRDDNKNVDNNHHQIAAVLRFFARIIRCFFCVSFMSRNLFLIIFRNHRRAVTFPREALFFSILTNSFSPKHLLAAGALNLNARATIQTIQEYYFVRSDEIAFVFVVLSSRF